MYINKFRKYYNNKWVNTSLIYSRIMGLTLYKFNVLKY